MPEEDLMKKLKRCRSLSAEWMTRDLINVTMKMLERLEKLERKVKRK